MDTSCIKFQEKTIEEYEIGQKIGTGSYATVKLGLYKKTGEKVAIKIYDKQKLLDPHKLKNVRREISILSKLNHPNIIKLYNVIEEGNSVTPRSHSGYFL